MNRYRWCLLLAAIPIVVAAQIVLRYHEAEVLQYLDRPDGSGAALLRIRSQGRKEIIAWDAGLKNRRTIYRFQNSVVNSRRIGISSDSKGENIVFPYQQRMVCIDATTGAEVWKSGLLSGVGDLTRADFINDGQHLVVSARDERTVNGSLIALTADTGKIISGSKVHGVVRYLTRMNRVAIQYGRQHTRFGQWDVLQLDGNEASLVESHDFVPREMLPNATQLDLDVTVQSSYLTRSSNASRSHTKHLSTVDLRRPTWLAPTVFRGRGDFSGKTLRIHSMGYGEWVLLLLLVGIATASWAIFLVREGQRSDWQWRPLVDAILLTALLALLCVQLRGAGWTEEQSRSQPAFLLRSAPIFFQSSVPSLLLAAALVAALGALFFERRPVYLWGALFICCALPVLLPLVAICLIAMKAGYRFKGGDQISDCVALATPVDSSGETAASDALPPSRKQLRFGISEMMLATAGVAIFIGVGQLGMFLIPTGCFLVGLVVLSVVLANKSLASTVLFVCVFFVGLFGAGHEVWKGTGTAVFSFAVPMFMAMAAMYGYRLSKEPVAPTSRAGFPPADRIAPN